MTEAVLIAAAFGALAGWFSGRQADRHVIYRARAKGLMDGRSERDWEVATLQLRIRRLEADVRRYGPSTNAGA